MMHHWIGAALMIVGAGGATVGFWLNQNLPDPPGPIPTIGGAILAFVGLLVWSF